MFCYQCEQTYNGKGCTIKGVCGKNDEVATLLDLLIYVTKGISIYADKAYRLGVRDKGVDKFVMEALFSSVTNVDFDPKAISLLILQAKTYREKIKELYLAECDKRKIAPEQVALPATVKIPEKIEEMIEFGKNFSIPLRKEKYGEDIVALQELAFYGLKGAAAYMDHALILLKDEPSLYRNFHEIISFLAQDCTDKDLLFTNVLKAGELNLLVMRLLDSAHTENFGHPSPTKVSIIPKKGKAILVSGHDLKDLEMLLIQTEGKGINVYTHGEMLPAHGYPNLNKFKHLAGNYGGAWQDQQSEFAFFPGSILMTTNCIQEPKDSYKYRMFISGLVGFPGLTHLDNYNFAKLIEAALQSPGFTEDPIEEKYITVGFGRNAVISQMDKIIKKIQEGKISRLFLVGGCDGAQSGRNYYTELAEKIPKDALILTLACGKYRFNKKSFGEIDGIPRLLDIGQCNDAYSAIAIVSALSDGLKCPFYALPVSYVFSWFEQKAVAILLTLLFLGVRNIYLGPSLPAYFTPAILKDISGKYCLKKISSPDDDLKEMIGSVDH